MQKMMKWETVFFRLLPLFFLPAVFVAAPAFAQAGKGEVAALASAGDQRDSCLEAVRLLEEQDRKLSRELQQIKREIGALSRNLEEPGWREAVAGVGYIFGLLGLASFFTARRKTKSEKNG